MIKFIEKFNELNKLDKGAFVVGMISALITILFGILQLLNVWNQSIVVCELAMAICMISQAVLQWKRNKILSIFSLGVALFVLVVAFIIVFVR